MYVGEQVRLRGKKQFLVIWTLSVILSLISPMNLYLSAPVFSLNVALDSAGVEAVSHIGMNDVYLRMAERTAFTT